MMTNRDLKAAKTHDEKRVAFLLLPLGGTGRGALKHFQSLYSLEKARFPKFACHVDTEPGPAEGADSRLRIGLNAAKVDDVLADPELHGPVAQILSERYPQFLDPNSIQDGSRTFRALTQLAVEFHLDQIVVQFNRCIRHLMRTSNAKLILPVFASSTGGGAGSALAVVLSLLFADQRFRSKVTEGLDPYLLAPPVLLVTEPFAYSVDANLPQANRILSNAYAFRLEVAELQRRRAIQYAFFSSLSNSAGAMLDTEQEITRNLGSNMFAFCKAWSFLKARFVDSVDTEKYTARYAARDLPECFPDATVPSFGEVPTKRHRSPRITVTLQGNGHASSQ